MSDRDEVADVLAEHRLATGHEGIPGDGRVAWIRCTCGYRENVETPNDDIRVAEAAWERHQADALMPLLAREDHTARHVIFTSGYEVGKAEARAEALRDAAAVCAKSPNPDWRYVGDFLTALAARSDQDTLT